MQRIAITAALRTPIGKIGGSLKNVPPEELGRVVVEGILKRIGLAPELIDEVVFGHCRQSSDSPDVARLIALKCGIPERVPAYTVMRHCASGMTAIHSAAMSILLGENDIVVAGGVESMSTAPFYVRNARFGVGTGNTQFLDSIVEAQFKAQPEELYGRFNMGDTAENVAEKFGISREDQDAFALASQEKAHTAIRAGLFENEIVPVEVPQRKGKPVAFAVDEFPRETSMELLAALKPVFRAGGTVTAGNSSGRNDGAAAVLLMTEQRAHELGLEPLAFLKAHGVAGVDPRYMGLGPVSAVERMMNKSGLSIEKMELIELNEAFAAQALGCIRSLSMKTERVNVNGGAIALGHPVGASGCRIVVTLLHEMRRRGAGLGLATPCAGGGMGEALVLELP